MTIGSATYFNYTMHVKLFIKNNIIKKHPEVPFTVHAVMQHLDTPKDHCVQGVFSLTMEIGQSTVYTLFFSWIMPFIQNLITNYCIAIGPLWREREQYLI